MSNAEGKLGRWDWTVAAFLFAITFALRVPFRSYMAYHWDSAQFALAIERYDMRISQPQPPGYFLYVMLGRLVSCFVDEPHAGLVWLSVIAGALLAAVAFLLATAMFGRHAGIASGVILATSPLCWFYSEIALTSIVDAALVTATVFACWSAIRSDGRWPEVLWMSVLFAAVAGVRQQSGAILAPVWCYTLLKLGRPRSIKPVFVVLLTGFFCSLWFVPMIIATGGFPEYMSLLHTKGHFDAPKTIWGGGGMNALLTNISVIGRTCWAGLLLAALISVGEFFPWVFGGQTEAKQHFYKTHADQLRFLALWILPMLLFWLGMYVTTPGYVLCFFPGLAIVAGVPVQRIATRLSGFFSGRELMPVKWSKPVALLLVCGCLAAVNTILFVCQPTQSHRFLAGLPFTGVEISRHDQQLVKCFRIIRERFRPKDVVIYHGNQYFYWGFRQFQYHLPEYRNVLLMTDASLPNELQRKHWVGQWRQTAFVDSADKLHGRIGLLVVPPGESVGLFGKYFDLSRAELLAAPGMKLYELR